MRLVIPEGRPNLSDPSDFLDAATVFFRQPGGGKPLCLRLPSRAHAEIVFTLGRLGLHGAVRLPASESDAAALKAPLDVRSAVNRRRAQQLARARASNERRVGDLAGLLENWLIHGRPRPERRAQTSQPANIKDR